MTVTPVATNKSLITKGFEISSPRTQSPAVSGRNTPEPGDEFKNQFKVKESTRNAQQMFEKERGDAKEQIHMVVIGHVDAGKSTLMGHMLFDLGNVPQRVMHKHEQECKKIGKQSFVYAWVLDETGEERSRGITMDVGSSKFETESKQVTLLDTPGHKVEIKIINLLKQKLIEIILGLHPQYDIWSESSRCSAFSGRRNSR